MGISQLLPFLKECSTNVNIKSYSGQTVAIDAYSWLHKGAIFCADKIAINQKTSVYVSYCVKRIEMLLSFNIKPILVFDGRYLPAKEETEKKRRERREINRKKSEEVLKINQVAESLKYLKQSVDITHEMALNLIKECRKRNIDCIVAPYEADAQLAYLNLKNFAQVIITEDSDLLVFGCLKVLFKMDAYGNGVLIENSKLHLALKMRKDSFTMEKFRHMCILSGCDYLQSLHGIGLKKALKFVKSCSDENVVELLPKLPFILGIKNLTVPQEYIKEFIEADRTFKYQLVYDPKDRIQVPLNESEENDFVGEMLDDETAFQLAIGNLDPMSLKKMDNYDPVRDATKVNGSNKNSVTSHQSIWNKNFTPRIVKPKSAFSAFISTKGISVSSNVKLPTRRPIEEEAKLETYPTAQDLLKMYATEKCSSLSNHGSEGKNEESCTDDGSGSPVLLSRSRNSVVKKRFAAFLESKNLKRSRYFAPENEIQVTSLLDIFDMEQKNKNESIGDVYSATGTTESREKLFNEFTDEENKSFPEAVSVDLSVDSNVRSQQENRCTSYVNCNKDLDKSHAEDEKQSETWVKTPVKTVLSPINRSPSLKSFYDSSRGVSSPYFRKSANECMTGGQTSPVSSKSNIKLKSTKKSKCMLMKSNQGTQQSLLNFGFRSRPKMEKEKT